MNATSLVMCSGSRAQSELMRDLEFAGYNCGLNATCFALSFFDLPMNIQSVASDLALGKNRLRSTSLLSIKECLTERRLSCEGFASASVMKVAESMGPHTIAILHGQVPDRVRVGHYWIVLRSGSRGLYVVDPGIAEGWLSESEVRATLIPSLSGYGLLVRSVGTDVVRHHLSSEQIDVEWPLTVTDGILRVSIPVRNDLGLPARIIGASAGCSCFKGLEIETPDAAIAANDVGVLSARFDALSIPPGQAEQKIFVTLSGNPRKTTIAIRFVRHAGRPRLAMCVPRALSIGRLRPSDVVTVSFTVVSSMGVVVTSWSSSDERVTIHAQGDPEDSFDGGYRKHRFVAVCTADAVGPIGVEVRFALSDLSVPAIIAQIGGLVCDPPD